MTAPSIMELWRQAGGDGRRYRDLLHEHGYTLRPGDPGYDEAPATLPCGFPGPAREPRCDVTDLLVSQCAHCRPPAPRGSESAWAADQVEDGPELGRWFAASYHGSCSDCGERIEPGDEIRADGEGGYLCGDCGQEDAR